MAILEMYTKEYDITKQCFDRCRNVIPIDILTFDHTFKSAFKVGYLHPLTNKFIKQYSGLFIAMNSRDQVVEWALTRTVGF